MKKLIVSGCSWGDTNFFSSFHPDMDCDWPKWPEILAEKLGMNVLIYVSVVQAKNIFTRLYVITYTKPINQK